MKQCTGCEKQKTSSEFGVKSGKPHTRCKLCVNKRQKEYNHRTGVSKTYKGQPRVDLTGNKIHRLTVVKNLGMDNKRRYWLCKCECGSEKAYEHGHLYSGKIKSCGCKMYTKGNENPCWKGCGELSGGRWDHIKRKRRNKEKRPFKISIEQAWDLFLKQNRKCALTGIELEFGETNKCKYSASLDRIDSKKGYVKGNVQWVHKDINRMKNVYSQEYFIEMCKAVTKSQKS